MRDNTQVNHQLHVMARSFTVDDFVPQPHVQRFTAEDRRRELLDETSMAVEIAEEARLPFITRMQIAREQRDRDIKQVEVDLLNFSVASWEEDLQHFSNTDGYNCPE
jgi:hypothetical protein